MKGAATEPHKETDRSIRSAHGGKSLRHTDYVLRHYLTTQGMAQAPQRLPAPWTAAGKGEQDEQRALPFDGALCDGTDNHRDVRRTVLTPEQAGT